ncbi:hypothetical protein D3C86_1152980 [compost metagenome]
MNNWGNISFLRSFVKEHLPTIDHNKYINSLIDELEELEDFIIDIADNYQADFDQFFAPLYNSEYKEVQLSLRKGKLPRIFPRAEFRIYGIKIDENCYVITGGAIKLSQKMQDHELTQLELDKMDLCKKYLIEQEILNKETFFELIEESNEDN